MPREARAGWIRNLFFIPSVSNAAANPHFNSTGAVNIITSLTLGFRFTLERFGFITTTVAGASAGSQVFKVRKGGASGTVLITLTLAYTSADTLGEVATEASPGSGITVEQLTFGDSDTLSVTRDSGGTDYTTKPEGLFYIRFRQRLQLDY